MDRPPATIPIPRSLLFANPVLCVAESPPPTEIGEALARDDGGPNKDGAKCPSVQLRLEDGEIESEKTEL